MPVFDDNRERAYRILTHPEAEWRVDTHTPMLRLSHDYVTLFSEELAPAIALGWLEKNRPGRAE